MLNEIEKLKHILSPEESNITHLECDWATRVIAYILNRNDIDFKIHTWKCYTKDTNNILIPFHMWIEVWNIIVDYKLNMWLDFKVTEGVFPVSEDGIKRESFIAFEYKDLEMTDFLYNLLTIK